MILTNISTPKNIPMVPTFNFQEGNYLFENFNYLQSLYYSHYDDNKNILICGATSSGKTICAELSITDTIQKGKKAIYLSPLKAVTQERFDDWTDKSHYFSNLKVEILTGDHKLTESKKKKIQEADLVLMTSEMLDTRTRYINNSSNNWITEVGIVVVDEAHLLTTNRGPALEVGLMRFTEINNNAKLLLLSATITNQNDVGNWIDTLNNNDTLILSTDWRPVDLHYHVIETSSKYFKSRITLMDTASNVIKNLTCSEDKVVLQLTSPDQIERMCAESRLKGGIKNTKILVFVHTKNIGKTLESALKKQGINCEFHNADLDKTKRNKLEKKFKEKLDVLISTSTLAWGVNLPARFVIILGDQRGIEKVSDIDLAQMAGRAGRFGMYDRGDVFLLGCDKKDSFEINSTLDYTLPFHLIAEICTQHIKTEQDAKQWYKRSYCCFKNPANINFISNNLQKLIQYNCVTLEQGTYKVTNLGRIARDLYLDPADIWTWNKNFKVINDKNQWNSDSWIAWAITSNIKTGSLDFVPSALKQLVLMYNNVFSPPRPIAVDNKAVLAMVYYQLIRNQYDSYMTRQIDSTISAYLQLFLKDSGRIFNAIKRICALNNYDVDSKLNVYKARIVYGVGSELAELVSIPGIGGTIANQLYNAGFSTLQDVQKNKNKLSDFIDRKANVTRILNGLKELEEAQNIDNLI